jgi:hypothetical protein
MGTTMFVLQLLVGVVLFMFASYFFWRIGDANAISPRWRNFPGMESLVVLVVLGGWAGGVSFVIHSVIAIVSN